MYGGGAACIWITTATVSGFLLQVHNEGGEKRVVVTKTLPGERWLQLLTSTKCRVEVCKADKTILSNADIKRLIGDKCDGVIGQLTEVRQHARQLVIVSVTPDPPPHRVAAVQNGKQWCCIN